MTTKKYIIYYNENANIIGYREHHFDWEEGEDIINDGKKVTIFAVVEGTCKNISIMNNMIKTLQKYSPRYKQVWVLDKPVPSTMAGNDIESRLNRAFFALENSHQETINTNKKVWKDFDAMLDYVDACLEVMD